MAACRVVSIHLLVPIKGLSTQPRLCYNTRTLRPIPEVMVQRCAFAFCLLRWLCICRLSCGRVVPLDSPGSLLKRRSKMASAIRKNFDSPDEVRPIPNGSVDVVKLGDLMAMRSTFNPGWKWSESVKPIAKTDSCQVHHIGYQVG